MERRYHGVLFEDIKGVVLKCGAQIYGQLLEAPPNGYTITLDFDGVTHYVLLHSEVAGVIKRVRVP